MIFTFAGIWKKDFVPADVGWIKRSAHICVGLRLFSDSDSLISTGATWLKHNSADNKGQT